MKQTKWGAHHPFKNSKQDVWDWIFKAVEIKSSMWVVGGSNSNQGDHSELFFGNPNFPPFLGTFIARDCGLGFITLSSTVLNKLQASFH